MKVLWISNVSISEIAEKEGFAKTSFGGWIQGLYRALKLNSSDVELVFLFPYVKNIYGELADMKYYSFVESSNSDDMVKYFEEIVEKEKPEVVHVFGTEYLHAYAMMKACEKAGLLDNTVTSIQGLVSIYAKHMYNNLPIGVSHGCTLSDIRRRTSISAYTRDFQIRGDFEKKVLLMSRNISGRTDWDMQCAYLYNKYAKYFYCSEVLRDSFYGVKKWDINSCERHSIFISQCDMALKGAHNAIEAVSYLISDFPDIKLYIAGGTNVFKDVKNKTKYDEYLESLILKYGLKDNIVFLGKVNEREMHDRFLASHVFVCPSSIENSSNSVCEAMICGTPVVASLVGGMTNLITHSEDGFLFQPDAPYMIAYYVRKLFIDDELAMDMSNNAIKIAEKRHSKETIVKDLLNIYNTISRRD